MQDRFEAAVVSMEEFLFHKGLSIEDFFSLVTNMYNSAEKVGVPLNEFPSHIEELKVNMDVLRKEISQEEKKKQDFLENNKKTLELIQKYIANKPILVTLANAEKRIRELEEELDNERRSNDLGKQNMGSVFETELEKATEELLPNMDMTYSMNMLKDALKNPSRYMGVISRMSYLYDGYRGIQQTNSFLNKS